MEAMLRLTDEQARTFRDAVAQARAMPGLIERVTALYADVQREIDIRRPRCDVSGRCCRFEEYGHRLFVTTLEVAAFVASSTKPAPQAVGNGCPYQIDGLCSVHTIRPFGCRIFFCDASATDWQQEQYEEFHLRLRQMHEQMNVPYLYVEWLAALKAVNDSTRVV
jgi:Fe-S-cluster containining protein